MNFDASSPPILVTGASGLIGSRLCAALAPRGPVVALDKDEPKRRVAAIDFVRCDLTSDAEVERALGEIRARHGGALTSVVHLAAYYDFSGEPSPLYETLTVEGTRRLLDGLSRFHVEQFLFSSSMLVMRPAEPGQMIDETSPVGAEWDYPRSKLAAEQVIAQRHGRIPVVILRIAGVYDEDCHSIPIAQHIRRIREKKLESYLLPGDPDHGQAFLHLDDLIDCIERVIARRKDLGSFQVFLVAEPELMTYRELQHRIGMRLHGKEWPTIRIPAAVAKAGAWIKDKLSTGEGQFIKPWMIDLADDHYPISIARARERLGFEPKRRLRTTLEVMLDRMVADPRGWYERNGLPYPD